MRKRYVIILLLTDGTRRTIPAYRFSVPSLKDIAAFEADTRTKENPRGFTVYGWYLTRK
jgi:hypothetical protein